MLPSLIHAVLSFGIPLLAGFGAGTYTLVTYTGTLTDNILAIGSVPAGFKYTVNTATPGAVKLIVERCLSYTGTTLTDDFDSMGQAEIVSMFGLEP